MKALRTSLYLALLAAALVLGTTSGLAAPSTSIVISQVYGGGGNSGAIYKNDFIELHNISSSAVSVAGWSVQYAAVTGTSWQVTNLTGSIPAGGYYLVQQAAGAAGTTSLPTPDATGTINMSSTNFKVALANNTTAFTVASPSGASLVDLVGVGPTANGFEGTPTALISNTTSASRNNSGSTDTDNNSSDFSIGTVAPRNSATTPFIPTATATQVKVETAADGSGAAVATQTLSVNTPTTVYAVSRSATNAFVANAAATWSLTSITGGVLAGDLVPATDNKSAVFTPHAAGSAVIHAAVSGLTSVDSGVITATAAQTNPTAVASAGSSTVVSNGQAITLTVTVTPGSNPTSTGITVTGNLSSLGGSPTQAFIAGANNTFSFPITIPSGLSGGAKALSFTITDDQSRTASASLTLTVSAGLTIIHTNDTHARVTPHKWVVPGHSFNPQIQFDDVGGVAYMGGKILEKVTAQPDAIVLDGGDISEGNPIGDWNGVGTPTGTYGDGTIVDYYKMLNAKLKLVPGRGGRGLDAMVVGNHDIRDITYFNNLRAASYVGDPVNGFHLLSMNICNKGTHTPYYEAYTILNVNGHKIGVVGYTTESADSPETEVTSLVDIVKCDWKSTDTTKIHFADIVNDLRNNQGCDLVFLLTHMGHSGLCTVTGANPTPILVDTADAKLPEVVVSGHWHTYCDTVWQPTSLNYKTIFTEAGSFQHYVGQLNIDGQGKYLGAQYYPIRSSGPNAVSPDSDIADLIAQRKIDYAATNPTYGVDQIIGYTADNLLLDNYMKWWSADEYPWSGNNTAGNWICDAVKWKASQLFSATGGCDLALEAGGGVRSDIVAGAIKYTNIYETFPWADDTIYVVSMTGQQLYDFFKVHGCDAAMSAGCHVTAFDGVPTSVTYNGQPINLTQTYKVGINNYMYLHDSANFATIDPNPQTSTYLARTALVEYTATFPQNNPYQAGPPRYTLNTEFSGGYRAVVTLISDSNSRTTFDCSIIRLLNATAETLAHRGTQQVPSSLVNADGTVNASNRLAETQLYRSYLGFRTGALKPGDIIEVWGKGAFFEGNPEFVDQEGVRADGVEFKIIGHDDSLAKPIFVSDIATALDDNHKNHYVKFIAKKTGTNTVVDQNGTIITVWNVDAFTKKTLPGNTNDLLVLTGAATSESYAMRLRCDNAVLASTLGITSLPATSTVISKVDQVPARISVPSLTLTATASVNNGTFYLSPTDDSQVASGSAGTNYGTSTTLFMQSATTTAQALGNERDWLKFDLSAIPAGSTITSAQLQLYCWNASATSLPVSVHGGSSDTWVESGASGITWNTQPTFGSALDTQTMTGGTVNLYYNWDVTSFAQSKLAGNKLVSLVAKPATENNATATTFRFDSKEFGSNTPTLKVATQPAGGTISVAQVQFFYRYSSDNTNWGSWTALSTDTSAPYAASFTFPNSYGYYEFYSIAQDNNGATEPVPNFADTAVRYMNPALNVQQAGTQLASGNSTINAGSSVVGTAAPAKSFTINNVSASALTGFYALVDGPNAGDFSVTTQPASSLNSSASSTLVVTFTPQASGARNAVLHIASDDTTPTSFDVNLTGTGTSGQTLSDWLNQIPGGTANQTPLAIPFGDGITNLMKYATGMNPATPGKQPGDVAKSGDTLTFIFTRSKQAVLDGVTFAVEWSDDLSSNSWSTVGVTMSALDQGSTDLVTATVPAGTQSHRFVRLRVTHP